MTFSIWVEVYIWRREQKRGPDERSNISNDEATTAAREDACQGSGGKVTEQKGVPTLRKKEKYSQKGVTCLRSEVGQVEYMATICARLQG